MQRMIQVKIKSIENIYLLKCKRSVFDNKDTTMKVENSDGIETDS